MVFKENQKMYSRTYYLRRKKVNFCKVFHPTGGTGSKVNSQGSLAAHIAQLLPQSRDVQLSTLPLDLP